MHDIEPYSAWKELYDSTGDADSPFYGVEYDNFSYTHKVYNYYIHPYWDEFGSETLFVKILFVDYELNLGILEFIGEWNDCINNDIMLLKQNLLDLMISMNIYKFILLCDHVFNFHGSDDCYYEELQESISENQGYIVLVNLQGPVLDEMKLYGLKTYIHFGKKFQDINWRKMDPQLLMEHIEHKL